MFFRFFRTRISKQCTIYFHLAPISPFTKRFKCISNVIFATVVILVTLCSAVGAKHITTVCSSVFCRKDSQPQACIFTMESDPFSFAYYPVLVTDPRWKIQKIFTMWMASKSVWCVHRSWGQLWKRARWSKSCAVIEYQRGQEGAWDCTPFP